MNHFWKLVQQMREAQKKYFKERTQAALIESRILERQVDLALARKKAEAAAPEREEDQVPW